MGVLELYAIGFLAIPSWGFFMGSHDSLSLVNMCTCSETEPFECHCVGPDLMDVPSNLSTPLETLIVMDTAIEVLKCKSLSPYAGTIRELMLFNLDNFYYFETDVFQSLHLLRTIYIHRAPKLLKIQPGVFDAHLPNLRILRIVATGLQEMPNLNHLKTSSVLHMIDLEHNHIQRITHHQISNVRVEQLSLNYNDLQAVEESAFSGSQIAKLSFKGNVRLQGLHRKAFSGLRNLRYIDLSNTSITFLPLEGLREIDVLKVQETESLKVFPSIFNFKYIKEAWLTYPYHCCAFKFPQAHDPLEWEKHLQFKKEYQAVCDHQNGTNTPKSEDGDGTWGQPNEFFHNSSTSIKNPVTTVMCGEIYTNYNELKCYPTPDAFNPCEDLMGNWGLRIPVWFISLSAVIGNLFVVIVIATSHFRMTVSKFLMCNLAIADLCIGLHLLLIAVVDACSVGVYFNYAIDWQEGNGCKVAGFLTIFGNILSVYTLAIITTERWYTISWAIHLNRRLKLRTAGRVMVAGWMCAIAMASLPLFGISSYTRTSICLPFEHKGKADAIYQLTLLSFNGMAFALICVGYGSMYKSIKEGGTASTTSRRSDLTVAKRMALLVFTDFACWAPIAFFALTALLGYPLITVTQTKILLVFFYPLNSCANPCLYALLTQQYRRDFFILMGRYGLCKERAERHRGAIGGKPLPYGSALQYKRTSTEGHGKTAKRHGESLVTTIVSIDLPMARTCSRSSARARNEGVRAIGGKGQVKTTENL